MKKQLKYRKLKSDQLHEKMYCVCRQCVGETRMIEENF